MFIEKMQLSESVWVNGIEKMQLSESVWVNVGHVQILEKGNFQLEICLDGNGACPHFRKK